MQIIFWSGTKCCDWNNKYVNRFLVRHKKFGLAQDILGPVKEQGKGINPFTKFGFCAGTKVFEEALNAVKFLGWLKKFGPAQNILGPVKGQGINLPKSDLLT